MAHIAIKSTGMTLEEKIAAQEALFGGAQAVPVTLQQCTTCGRKFNQKALASHSKICAKVFVEKRKAFDMKAARADDEILKAQRKAESRKEEVDAKLAALREKSKKSWKNESARLRNAANAASGGPMIEMADDRVECPKCNRKFAPLTAERHIPKCKAKPKNVEPASVLPKQTKNIGLKPKPWKRKRDERRKAKKTRVPTRPAPRKKSPGARKKSPSPRAKAPASQHVARKSARIETNEKSLEERIAAQEALFGGAQAALVQLKQCTTCGRRFNAKALAHHSKICAKVFVEKRKAFDMKAARADDDILKAQKQAEHKKAEIEASLAIIKEKAKKAWRAESARLRNAANAAHGGPVIEVADDRVECPKCGRKFAERTAKRHIPRCTAKPKATESPEQSKQRNNQNRLKPNAPKRGNKRPIARRPLSGRPLPKKPAADKTGIATPTPSLSRSITASPSPSPSVSSKGSFLKRSQSSIAKKPRKRKPAKARVSLFDRAAVDTRMPCPHCNRKLNKRILPDHIKLCKPKEVEEGMQF